MSKETEVIKFFGNLAYEAGGEFYFPIHVVVQIINYCTKLNVAISGIDFFTINNNKLVPVNPINSVDTTSILNEDYLWDEKVDKCNSFALEVINLESAKNPNQLCNLVITEL